MTEIRAACSPGEVRAVAVRVGAVRDGAGQGGAGQGGAVLGGAVLDYAVERAGVLHGVGDRVRGRVIAPVPAMAGAFILLPGDAEGFLPDSLGGAGLAAGAAVTVLVTRAAQGGKGPRLSARTEQSGPGGPALLGRGPGAIQRLLSLHPGAEVIVDDAAAAIGIVARVVARAWDETLETVVAGLGDPVSDLPGGVRARIHPTPALVAIDLDSGGASGERRPKAAAQREANRAALPGLALAIRLRNLSGAIVVDLAGMAAKARVGLAPDFSAALAGDPLRPRFLGFTALGLAEILRPRVHPPVHELLAGAHAAGLAALRALMRRAEASPGAGVALRCAPDVAGALQADGAARSDLARRTGRPLMMRSDPALLPGRWSLDDLGRP